jgi:hypothetical protein
MGEQVTTTLDDDLYDEVCREHRDTGKSKSQVVNDRVRAGFNGDAATLGDTLLPVFGQSLFIAGFVVAMFAMFAGGIAMSLLGLGLMLGAKVDEYMEKHDVPPLKALIRVLGA